MARVVVTLSSADRKLFQDCLEELPQAYIYSMTLLARAYTTQVTPLLMELDKSSQQHAAALQELAKSKADVVSALASALKTNNIPTTSPIAFSAALAKIASETSLNKLAMNRELAQRGLYSSNYVQECLDELNYFKKQNLVDQAIHYGKLAHTVIMQDPQHPLGISTCQELTELYLQANQLAQAVPVLLDGVKTAKAASNGEGERAFLQTLAKVHSQLKDYAASQKYSFQALDLSRQLYGPHDERTISLLTALAVGFLNLQSFTEALDTVNLAKDTLKLSCPSYYSLLLRILNIEAYVHIVNKQVNAATEVLRHCQSILTNEKAANSTLLADMKEKAEYCDSLNRRSELGPFFTRELAERKRQESASPQQHSSAARNPRLKP